MRKAQEWDIVRDLMWTEVEASVCSESPEKVSFIIINNNNNNNNNNNGLLSTYPQGGSSSDNYLS